MGLGWAKESEEAVSVRASDFGACMFCSDVGAYC
jgi:hypothetical protein